MKTLLISSALSCLSLLLPAQPQINGVVVPEEIDEGTNLFYSADVVNPNNPQFRYQWNFGNGETKQVQGSNQVSFIYRDNGSYTITLIVTDDQGQSATATTSVQVANVPPQILVAQGAEKNNADKLVDFSAIVYEPGDDQLTYEWDFGDGNTETKTDSKYTSHRYQNKGAYTVTLTVTDDEGESHTYTFVVAVAVDWVAAVSGSVSDSVLGHSATLYYHAATIGNCVKQLTLYDDVSRSILMFAENSPNRLQNRNIPLTYDSQQGMNASFSYDLEEGLYNIVKTMNSVVDQADDHQLQAQTGGMLPTTNIWEALEGGQPQYNYQQWWEQGANFIATGGTLETGPLVGNTMSATYQISMVDDGGGGGSIQVSGSFDIDFNDFSYEQMQQGCEDNPPEFSLVSYTPENEKKNVHTRHPCIELEFSEEVDLNSLNHTSVKLGYYDQAYNPIFIPLAFEKLSENWFKVVPAATLRPGIIYEVFVNGGEYGVRSTEGGLMEENYHWQFSTMIEPTSARIRVYQSVADKPLVPGKETMVRIVLGWDKPDDVADESFVRSFPANVTIKNSSNESVGEPMSGAVFKYPPDASADQVRMATNSVNVYGWKPKEKDGENIAIEVVPLYQECVPEDEQVKFKLNKSVTHWDKSLELTVDYYFLKFHTWSDGIPPDYMTLGDQNMERAARFSEQIYPILSMTPYNRGIYLVDNAYFVEQSGLSNLDSLGALLGIAPIVGMTEKIWNQKMYDKVMHDFYFDVGNNTSADIVVAFHPQLDYLAPGKTFLNVSDKNEKKIPVGKRFVAMVLTPGIVTRTVLEHEYGHSFGLDHEPYSTSEEQTKEIGEKPLNIWENTASHNHIFGFRIYETDQSGANKDCSEGNAESENLVNIMFPNMKHVFRNDVFIHDKQYDQVLDHFDVTMPSGTSFFQEYFTPERWMASLEDPGVAPRPEVKPYLRVRGFIEDGQAILKEARVVELEYPPQPTSGAYTLVAADRNGTTLASVNLGLDSFKFGCDFDDLPERGYFTTHLNYLDDIGQLSLNRNSQVLGTLSVSENPPNVNFYNLEPNDVLQPGEKEISWTATDPDGDPIWFMLSYSPNGVDDWQMLGKTSSSEMTINTEFLPPGDSPTLRIEANDGFHRGSHQLPINLQSELRVLSYGPMEEDHSKSIYVKFNSPIDHRILSAGEYFQIIDANTNQPLEAAISYDHDRCVAYLQPYEPLKPGDFYTIRLRKSGKPLPVGIGQRPVAQETTPPEVEPAKKSKKFKGFVKKIIQEEADALFGRNDNQESDRLESRAKQQTMPGEVLKDIYGNQLIEEVQWEYVPR